jgi:Zn ribbon nucleic-acid-binding protein
MRCPFCGSQDIRNYIDRENNLSWFLCLNCRYQGYDAALLHATYNDNDVCITATSPFDGFKTKKK